jgi:hypothetical protein
MPVNARHQIYRGMPGIVRAITSQPLEACIVCSVAGIRGRGDNAPPPWRRT